MSAEASQEMSEAVLGLGGEAWHTFALTEVLDRLGSAADGLGHVDAASRLDRIGPNQAVSPKAERWWAELAESLAEPLQLLLVVVAVLSAVFGEIRDAVAIAVIIVVVAGIETVSEQRAKRAIEALRQLAAPTARILRDDVVVICPVAEVVPGDVVVMETGDVVAADGRVLAGVGLRIDESALTGEAVAAAKSPNAVDRQAPLAERTSMVYAGTNVVAGEGRAVVTATGPTTEVGRLGRSVARERPPATPLQSAMAELSRVVLIIAIGASVLVPAVGVAAGRPVREMLLAGLGLAFATIPEELPILVTVLLAIAGRQLARRGALLRRLDAGETIGAVTMVVTDKTGTLTENHLKIATIVGDRREVLACARATQAPGGPGAEPMEAALAALATEAGIDQPGEPVVGWPFDPDRKLVSRCWRHAEQLFVAVGGAPEAVLGSCTMLDNDRHKLLVRVSELAARGLRVIAYARREVSTEPTDRDEAEQNLGFVGFVAFEDPIRADAARAVTRLGDAGVGTIVVTGDHPLTGAAAARQVGLAVGMVMEGGDALARVDDDALDRALQPGVVVARAMPADKLRIVRLLQRRGEIVAVTGDGVNDGPALAAANVGIAMGRRGSDLAKAAADIVLTDDAFSTIDAAVEKGRSVASQLRRAVAFYLGAKLALVAVMTIPLALGHPAPFAPVHIVLLELFMDVGASFAFVSEPAAPAAMLRPPSPPGARFLNRIVLTAILATGATLAAATLPVYLLIQSDHPLAVARASAIAVWLSAHTLVAWSLRAQPALPSRANPAFPVWTAAAIITAITLASTPAGGLVGLDPISVTVAAVVVGATIAVATVGGFALHTLRLGIRL